MGNEQSAMPDYDQEPKTLTSKSLKAVAEYIKRPGGGAKRVVFIVGAGISTSAGIPDFRSPETGLYANLARLNLPHPEAVFELSFFRENPVPFYTLAHELYPGKYHPTIAHALIALFEKKGILLHCYTQNIDCLELAAGVSSHKITAAHGSFATQRCIDCKTPYPDDLMKKHVEEKSVPTCEVPQCGGLVKPDIVFFGEALPKEFFENVGFATVADLAIIMGTSLTVQPFASLPWKIQQGVPRLLINREQVGDIGYRGDDVVFLDNCDKGVIQLAKELGWEKELEDMWLEMLPEEKRKAYAADKDKAFEEEEARTKEDIDKNVMEEIERIKRDMEKDMDKVSAMRTSLGLPGDIGEEELKASEDKAKQEVSTEKIREFFKKVSLEEGPGTSSNENGASKGNL